MGEGGPAAAAVVGTIGERGRREEEGGPGCDGEVEVGERVGGGCERVWTALKRLLSFMLSVFVIELV